MDIIIEEYRISSVQRETQMKFNVLVIFDFECFQFKQNINRCIVICSVIWLPFIEYSALKYISQRTMLSSWKTLFRSPLMVSR